jgi:cytochrome c553
MRQAPDSRFAENANTLYRNSLGHNGVACESCHGAPHAEWPSREANDNRAAIQLQGHRGPILECTVCHGTTLSPTLDGPHGLHPVGDTSWADGNHERFFESNRTACVACHGNNLAGTVLSVTPVTRTLSVEGRTVTLAAGTQVGCTHCHRLP